MGAPNTTQASPGLNVLTPGQPVANLPITVQGGMFPPNSNNLGATSIMAEHSSAHLPINVLVQNEGLPAAPLAAVLSGSGGPPGDGGNVSAPALGVPFGSGSSGGAGIDGSGGANFNNPQGVVGDVSLGAQMNPANLTLAGGTAATQYGG